MILSPQDRKEVLTLAAKLLVEEIRKDAGGDLTSLIVLPTATVGHLIGLSPRQLTTRLPITAIGPSSHGVTLRALQDYISTTTCPPEKG